MSSKPSRTRGTRWWVAAVALLVTLGLGEFALRMILDRGGVRPGDGAAAYFRALGTHPSDVKDSPATPGPKTAFRIVAMGDSTVKGFPYAPALSFVSFLALGLTEAMGRKFDWEIVAMEGRSSQGVLANLESAFACQPDLLLLYIGHNEFAHRISRESPFGVKSRSAMESIFRGYSLLYKGLRAGGAFRRSQELDGLPAMFRSELTHGMRLLSFGNPQDRTDNIPMDSVEIGYHWDRFAANIREITRQVSSRGIPFAIVEPASSLLHAPLTAILDGIGVNAYEVWRTATLADTWEFYGIARDSDAAPIRLASQGIDDLREAAGTIPTIALEDEPVRVVDSATGAHRLDSFPIEKRYIDLVHPMPALAAEFAERVARALPSGVPRLDAQDPEAVKRFRAACERQLLRSEVAPLLANGDALGRQLMAQMHLEYGNREACEQDVKVIPPEERTFGMVLLLDLALRWRGARQDANAALDRMSSLHADWKPSLDWWRARADR